MLGAEFFTPTEVVERTIELADGSKKVLWFKHLTNVELERARNASRSANEDERASWQARMVALSLCEPDGKPAVSFDDAKRIKPDVMDRIVEAVLDINGLKAKPGASAGNA